MATIVQITDLHVHQDAAGTLLDVPTWNTLDEALRILEQQVPGWDWLVLTGDLAQDEALGTYEALAARLGDRLERTLMIPGNHDDPALMQQVFNGAFDEGGAHFAQVVDGWLLIGLDSHVDGKVSGHVGEDQCAWAQQQLDAQPDLPVVLFVHHPPVSIGAAWLDAMGLEQPEPVHELVRRNAGRMHAVVCGHVHQDTRNELHGVPVFTSPSTAFQFEPGGDLPGLDLIPPGFRVLELGDELSTRVIRAERLRFEPVYRGEGY